MYLEFDPKTVTILAAALVLSLLVRAVAQVVTLQPPELGFRFSAGCRESRA